MRLFVVLLLLLLAVGCAAKAQWLPKANGGYLLTTKAAAEDQAFAQFRRTAEDLCGTRYAMSPPVVTGKGWAFSAGFGSYGGSTVTMQSELTCQ
jgi:hypothetical protein